MQTDETTVRGTELAASGNGSGDGTGDGLSDDAEQRFLHEIDALVRRADTLLGDLGRVEFRNGDTCRDFLVQVGELQALLQRYYGDAVDLADWYDMRARVRVARAYVLLTAKNPSLRTRYEEPYGEDADLRALAQYTGRETGETAKQMAFLEGAALRERESRLRNRAALLKAKGDLVDTQNYNIRFLGDGRHPVDIW